MSEFSLDTGNSDPKQRDLLEDVARWLIKKCRHRVLEIYKDRVGVFAYLMNMPGGNKYFLIAKGSCLWRDIVSCQSVLPQRAISASVPSIILAWKLKDEGSNMIVRFYRFKADEIIRDNLGTNMRKGVEMLNFNIRLAERWSPQQTKLLSA